MTEERKTEDARLVRDNFFEELPECKTPEDYRQFMIKYFSNQQAYEEINLLLGQAEMNKVPIGAIPEFKDYFRDIAYNEFFRRKERFTYEEIQLGFMK